MKKKIINQITYGRWFANQRMAGALCMKTDAPTPEEQAILDKVKESYETFKAEIKSTLLAETKTSTERLTEIDTKLESMKEFAAVKAEVANLQAMVKAMKELGINGKEKLGGSVKEQMTALIGKAEGENKGGTQREAWEKFCKHETNGFELKLDSSKFSRKAASTMQISDHNGGSAYNPQVELVPGYVDLVRNHPFIEDYANSSATDKTRIAYVEKKNPQGQCAFTAEGGLKPLIDFTWATSIASVKKVADKIKISTEMLDDIDFMAAAVELELHYQVDIVTDNELLSGSGVDPHLSGISILVGGYVLGAGVINTILPNNVDAIVAGTAQLESLNFTPNLAFVNPIDGANMMLVKTSLGEYTESPSVVVVQNGIPYIGGVRLVKTNQIPVGKFLLADMTRFMIRNYKPFVIQYGWVNDDFEKNFVTVIGERRLASYIYSNHLGAFIYDTFANVKTAIVAAP